MARGRLCLLVAVLLVLDACGTGPSAPTAGGERRSTTAVPEVSVTHATGACHEDQGTPDRTCTPGVANPAVNQGNIAQTICKSGWTATVRPPASYTDRLKVQQIAEYGYTDTNPADYEEDHLMPLELGGNPTDPHNLWPQKRQASTGASDKDELENYLHRSVCAGQKPLSQAQHDITTDWVAAYCKARLPKCPDGVHPKQ
jgi:hypothetical protein